jgi:hypothetical protein
MHRTKLPLILIYLFIFYLLITLFYLATRYVTQTIGPILSDIWKIGGQNRNERKIKCSVLAISCREERKYMESFREWSRFFPSAVTKLLLSYFLQCVTIFGPFLKAQMLLP